MSKDYIAEQVSWLDGIITHPENPTLFDDDGLLAIQKELASRWSKENRLDLLNDLAGKHGEERVLAVIDQIIYANSKRNWEQAGKETDNSLDSFIRILWEPLKEIGFEYSFEKMGNKTKFCVTKCSMYDLARQLNAKNWFYHLVCLTDEPTIIGFNHKIEFTRTRTLMQGYPDCDHCYTDHSS